MVPSLRLATVAGDQGAPQFLQLLREWEEAGRDVMKKQSEASDASEEQGGSRGE